MATATANRIVLISGASRGIGRGVTEAFVARPLHTVIAAVRDVDHATAQSLASLSCGANSRIIVVKIDSRSPTDAAAVVEQLQSHDGINKIDMVIANAAISNCYQTVIKTPLAEVQDHFAVNVVGTLALFQATCPLLKASAAP